MYELLAPADRPAALLGWWTLKEAWSKREGRGLHLGEFAAVRAIRADHAANACVWIGHDRIVGLCCDALAEVAPLQWTATAAEPARWHVSAVNPPC